MRSRMGARGLLQTRRAKRTPSGGHPLRVAHDLFRVASLIWSGPRWSSTPSIWRICGARHLATGGEVPLVQGGSRLPRRRASRAGRPSMLRVSSESWGPGDDVVLLDGGAEPVGLSAGEAVSAVCLEPRRYYLARIGCRSRGRNRRCGWCSHQVERAERAARFGSTVVGEGIGCRLTPPSEATCFLGDSRRKLPPCQRTCRPS